MIIQIPQSQPTQANAGFIAQYSFSMVTVISSLILSGLALLPLRG